uniref:Fe2OG dioxygenase domain-containing protein n=1 Tax=Phaeomonas parva TaxID=124430 RepID=A0A7S1UDT5_9STRA|mmetsp:Transcript_43668/g.137046  ORF Transcript_43668/g.137046 Transcript_43668/m.137046 type:complete len:387 (+) Transcript_43668:215-1375(+)
MMPWRKSSRRMQRRSLSTRSTFWASRSTWSSEASASCSAARARATAAPCATRLRSSLPEVSSAQQAPPSQAPMPSAPSVPYPLFHVLSFLVPSRNKLTAARDEKGRITAGFVRRKPGVHELDLVLEGAVVAPQALAICPSIQRFHEELAPKLIDVLHAVHPELRITVVDTIKVQLNEGVGGCFPMHYDTSGAHSRRTLTMLLYLNEDWAPGDGGELRLFPFPYQTVDIAPRLGTLAMFCATEMLHRVLPSRARRVCLSVWFAAEPAAAHRSFPNRAPPGLPAESAGFLRFLMQRDNRRLLSKVWFREEYATSFVDAFGGAGGGGGDGGGGGVDDDGRSEAEKAEELRRVLDLDARETDKAAQLLPHGLMDRLKATLLFATPDVEAA